MNRILPPVTLPGHIVAHRPPEDARTAKLRQAAHDFESLLVKQLLTAAKIGGEGEHAQGGYAGMAVDALANGIEKGGGLGLAQRIEQALAGASRAGPPDRD